VTTHPPCGAEWQGVNTCHCTADGCHQTFASVAAFDAHRAGPNRKDPTTRGRIAGVCAGPPGAGLVDAGRDYPCWGFVTRETPDRDDKGRITGAD
jgi:hypothetical protein